MIEVPSAHAPASNAPGETIRALRKRLGLTLGEVSARTGLGVSTLSKLEKGHASLSYEKLHLISRGLGVDMAQVLEPSGSAAVVGARGVPSTPAGYSAGRRIVQRRGEGMAVGNRTYSQTYLATELLNKRLTPMVTEVRARSLDEFFAEFGGFIHHPGEEFSYALEGRIEFHTELYAPVVLNPGDSVYFDSAMGHAYLAVGEGPCRLLSVCESVGDAHPSMRAPAEMPPAVQRADAGAAKAPQAAPAERRKRHP
ncbi:MULTISPECIES: XRE family transcriptional regulator [unclassified Variovorax]|uniref:helix-turn-helix domain-containing protein n=1 Tax=unclassified Variovorax TaxID=663243 RepID=UPI0025765770|nr:MULTISPECIES: XRE family transcriptional regulator [unclassified Variovorax]MDM0091446.1 XRE family transcriptional regulator [Variovorax sp. J22G40]MDM0149644.1 XRE family transcriptional regulator [Variovorax sp. J2P1-31]